MRLGQSSLAILMIIVLTTGCGKVKLDLAEDASEKIDPTTELVSNGEFIAAAQKSYVTENGFVVDSAVGAVLSKTESETSSGFKVFSTVQGRLQSEKSIAQ